MSIIIIENIQNVMVAVTVEYCFNQKQSFLARSNVDHIWHQNKKAYIVVGFVCAIVSSPVTSWTLSALCGSEVELGFSFASAEALLLVKEPSIDSTVSSIGAGSIYDERTVEDERISENRQFSEEIPDAPLC